MGTTPAVDVLASLIYSPRPLMHAIYCEENYANYAWNILKVTFLITLRVELSDLNITVMVTWIFSAETCKFTSQLKDDHNCEVLLPWFGFLF